MDKKVMKTAEYNVADLESIITGAEGKGNVEFQFVGIVPLKELINIKTSSFEAKPSYQREPLSNRRSKTIRGIFLSMVEAYILHQHKLLKCSSDLTAGTSLQKYAMKLNGDEVLLNRSPVYVVVEKDKGGTRFLRSPEGNGLINALPTIFGNEVTLPQRGPINGREDAAIKQFKGKKFYELPDEVQEFIQNNICVPLVLVTPNDAYERYLYEMLNAGCKQSTNDLTNSQCAGNPKYDIASKAAKGMLSATVVDSYVSEPVATAWANFIGIGKKGSYNTAFNLMTRFLARNTPTWQGDAKSKKALYSSRKAVSKETERKYEAETEWAMMCIFNAVYVLDGYPDCMGVHTLQGMSAYLSDEVDRRLNAAGKRSTAPARKRVLNELVKELVSNHRAFACTMKTLITNKMPDGVLNVYSRFMAPDFIGDKSKLYRYERKYSSLKTYESTPAKTVVAHSVLNEVLKDTGHDKKRTDFVRCYLVQKVEETCKVSAKKAKGAV